MKCNHEKLTKRLKGKYITIICPKCGKWILKGKKTGGGCFGFPKKLKEKIYD